MKIYVLTKGVYSGYHIITATHDKKLAERLKSKFTKDSYGGKVYIEEYDDAEALLRPVFFLTFDNTGACIESESTNDEFAYSEDEYENENSGRYFVYVVADDLDSAIKIGAERRAMFIAKKLGL